MHKAGKSDLDRDLACWDGKSSSDIQAIYDRHCDAQSFAKNLVSLMTTGVQQKGASWMLKCYLEQGGFLDAQDIRAIYASIPRLTDWETRLHTLQSMPYMPIEPRDRELVEVFVREGLTDENKFIRAWSYNGMYELAGSFPELRKAACQFFEMAMRDESPSVKARIRNLLKKMDW